MTERQASHIPLQSISLIAKYWSNSAQQFLIYMKNTSLQHNKSSVQFAITRKGQRDLMVVIRGFKELRMEMRSLHLFTPTLWLTPTSVLTWGNEKQTTKQPPPQLAFTLGLLRKEWKRAKACTKEMHGAGGKPQRAKTLLTGRWPFPRIDAAFSKSPSAARAKSHLSYIPLSILQEP